jgi:hypothetical protein
VQGTRNQSQPSWLEENEPVAHYACRYQIRVDLTKVFLAPPLSQAYKSNITLSLANWMKRTKEDAKGNLGFLGHLFSPGRVFVPVSFVMPTSRVQAERQDVPFIR